MRMRRIKTQKEFDNIPEGFQGEIIITSGHVKIYDNSCVFARGNSRVFAYDNSRVFAYDNSRVFAYGNSCVFAYDNSRVFAYGNSCVFAYDNSCVFARGDSRVFACDNSCVNAYDNSRVNAYGNSIVTIEKKIKSLKLLQEATLICRDCKIKPQVKDKTAHIVYTKTAKYTKKLLFDIYGFDKQKNKIILYKSVRDDFTDFYTGKIKYENVVECPDFNPDPDIECGHALHLSPTPELTQIFNQGKILKCEVDKKDIVVHKSGIKKVRCKKVKVLKEVKL